MELVKNCNILLLKLILQKAKMLFEISVAAPGMKKADFNINMNDGSITISGERKFEEKKDEKNYHSVETQYGFFFKNIPLFLKILKKTK